MTPNAELSFVVENAGVVLGSTEYRTSSEAKTAIHLGSWVVITRRMGGASSIFGGRCIEFC